MLNEGFEANVARNIVVHLTHLYGDAPLSASISAGR